MELRATLLGNHARNARNVRARNARNVRARNARNVRARARARDAATSARQLAAPRTQPALHTQPTHTAYAHCPRTQTTPASSHGDMGRGRGQVRD